MPAKWSFAGARGAVKAIYDSDGALTVSVEVTVWNDEVMEALKAGALNVPAEWSPTDLELDEILMRAEDGLQAHPDEMVDACIGQVAETLATSAQKVYAYANEENQ